MQPLLVRLFAMCALLFSSAPILSAQTYGQLDGAWIHAGFIQALKQTASVPLAMKEVGQGHPFWVEIDSTNAEGLIKVGYGFGAMEEQVLRKTRLHGDDLRWVMGTEHSPEWSLSLDDRSASFIALYDVGNLGGMPVVLGRLPSERQDALFLMERIINAAVLYGAYRDATGARYQFSTNMTAEWKGARVQTHVDVDPTTHDVILTVEQPSGRMLTYKAERVGSALKLIDEQGTVLALEAE